MHNFIHIKKGIVLLSLLAAGLTAAQAQERDTSQYSTDTTTVKIKMKSLKGVKVKGLIIDGNTGNALPGVNVTVTDFSAKITNENGSFEIVVPDYRSALLISLDGYHSKLVPVFKGKDLRVSLYPLTYPSIYRQLTLPNGDKSTLAQSTSAAYVLNPHGAWSLNSETADTYLQGNIPGVNVIRKSSTPGIGANVFIRGFNSLYANSQPLYVVDGMIYNSESFGTSLTTGHSNNPLQFLDPRDIESVNVVKDAAGAVVFGSRASNGVIFIKTHHARELATKIDFSISSGINLTPKQLPILNAAGYRTYLSDVLVSQGLDRTAISALPYMNDSRAESNTEYYKYHNETNWQDQVFRQSYDQSYFLRILGGDNIAKYGLSISYSKDKGIIDQTGSTRYTARFNSDLNLTKKLTGNTHLSIGFGEQQLKDQGISAISNPIFLSLVKAPFLALNDVNSSGDVSPNLADADIFGVSNPRALIEKGNNLKKAYRFFGSVNFDYKFNARFKLSNLTGISYDKTQESLFMPNRGVASDTLSNTIANSRLGTQVIRYFSLYNDLNLSYQQTFNKHHKVLAKAGLRYTSNDSESDYALGFNSATDELVSIGNSDLTTRIFGGGIGKWNSFNTYATADYSFADKYLLTAGFSLDGSSRFGPQADAGLRINGYTFAVLPAVAAAWIISSEDFMSGMKDINLLKFRLSYGLTGNDDIGNYTARKIYLSQNLLGMQGNVRGNIANPQIQWEQVSKFNTGLDAAFFNERLSLSLDFFINKTNKMLTYQPANTIVGIGSYVSNDGGMKTQGLDFGLNGRILNKGLKWDAGLNIGSYRSKITTLPQRIISSYAGATYISAVGSAPNLFYGHRFNGVYSTAADATAAGYRTLNKSNVLVAFGAGDARFINTDQDAAGVIGDNDRVVIGDPNPDIYGGFSNTFSYRNWSLSALMSFSLGNDVYNYTRAQLESANGYYNQSQALLNRWRGEGQLTETPRAAYGDPLGNARFSDRWIEDGSYARLRTLTLGYNIPLKSAFFKSAKVYGTANNLFTLSKYKGYDPEFGISGSPFSQGVDNTLEPQFRSFQFTLRVGL
ncbi:SusC/RagA family TonB-linked outer membrane protein [Pedobacter sp. GR22-6]|uniref:SusC/RagA family TonB-linked outer membrane protein n=1 Tax=Pedobacter sp. GR22-6 TaxID=3127957 RepID=UPI00307D75A5